MPWYVSLSLGVLVFFGEIGVTVGDLREDVPRERALLGLRVGVGLLEVLHEHPEAEALQNPANELVRLARGRLERELLREAVDVRLLRHVRKYELDESPAAQLVEEEPVLARLESRLGDLRAADDEPAAGAIVDLADELDDFLGGEVRRRLQRQVELVDDEEHAVVERRIDALLQVARMSRLAEASADAGEFAHHAALRPPHAHAHVLGRAVVVGALELEERRHNDAYRLSLKR